MAWTSVGFDGTITELEWSSKMAGLLGNGYVAAGNSDCLVTAVSGARQVSVAAGSLYGDGVVSTNSAPETLALTTPVNGQWYAVCLRRTWATNSAALVAVAGATTSTTTPTAPPTSFPVLNADPGVLTDQPIAWAWCNSANTTVVVYDIRLKAVKSLPPVVATSAERDAKFMSPTQGLQVWRDDLGAVETYYGLYNSSTNPGGRDTAGWYVDTRQTGLRPIQPPSVVIATGSGSANALGVISYTGASSVSFNNVFTENYRHYKIIVQHILTANTGLNLRFRTSGTDNTAGLYNNHHAFWGTGGNGANIIANSNVFGALFGHNVQRGTYEVYNPQTPTKTLATFFGAAENDSLGSTEQHVSSALHKSLTQFDGFTIFPTSGTFTGTVQVFGYND